METQTIYLVSEVGSSTLGIAFIYLSDAETHQEAREAETGLTYEILPLKLIG